MHKRGLYRHAVSVRLSVTFVHSVKTNKHVFKFFSLSGSHTILLFRTQLMAVFQREPAVGKISILDQHLTFGSINDGLCDQQYIAIKTKCDISPSREEHRRWEMLCRASCMETCHQSRLSSAWREQSRCSPRSNERSQSRRLSSLSKDRR